MTSVTDDQKSVEQSKADRNQPFRALKYPNFRLFWFGQMVSMVGSWMQNLSQSWLVLILADPAARTYFFAHGGDAAVAQSAHVSDAVQSTANHLQGLINFANGLPILALSLFAGVLVDRVNKRKILLGTQVVAMGCALAIGITIRNGTVTPLSVMVVAFVLGLSMAVDMPSRQSFVVELTGREDLPSAVALNSSVFNASRALGPALAGLILVSHIGLADIFFINTASYLAPTAGLLLMRGKGLGDPKPHPSSANESLLSNFKAGFQYVMSNHAAKNLMLLVAGFGLFGFSFNVLIPTFVRFTLLPHASGAAQLTAFSHLETVRGIGALIGAISIGMFSSVARQKSQLIIGSMVSGIFLVGFGLVRSLLVADLLMAIVSFGFVLTFATSNTILQMSTPDHLRGRVMSIYLLMFIGTGPIGSLLAGDLAAKIGDPRTIVCFAAASLAIGIFTCFRPGGLTALKIKT